MRSDADYTATLIENTRAQLLSDFDTWLQVCYLVITPLSYLSRTWAPGYRQALRICICCITIFSTWLQEEMGFGASSLPREPAPSPKLEAPDMDEP